MNKKEINVTKEELYDYYKDMVNPKCVLIPNPVIIDSKITSKLNNKNIISVGRLSPEKGFEDLIDVMKIISKKDKDITLTICGDGYLRSKVEEKIKDLKLEKKVKLLKDEIEKNNRVLKSRSNKLE